VSALLELQQKLLATSATIGQLERAVAAEPDSIALRLNLSSVTNQFEVLQAEFLALATRQALDVCTYRLFDAGQRTVSPTLRGFSGALYDFQTAISALFDSLKNGRRLRARLSPDVLEATTFGFGYAFAGSVGVVLTIEQERLLFGGGLLDDTVTTFFSIARAPTHEDIVEIGRRLGPAPLRAIYNWANAHVEDGLGADVTWRKGEQVTERLYLEPPQLARLSAAIAATSEETIEAVEWSGMLTGVVMGTRRFAFEPDGGEAVTGTFTEAINEAHTVTLPKRYRVRLEKVTKIQYSSEEPQVSWRLISLREEA
jgi:hypothetical protein